MTNQRKRMRDRDREKQRKRMRDRDRGNQRKKKREPMKAKTAELL
jgi:hypothetical protein